MNDPQITLEFNVIKERLCSFANSDLARAELQALSPILNERLCRDAMAQTTAARRILDAAGAPPLSAMKDLEEVLALSDKGSMLSAGQLGSVSVFLGSCRRMKLYLKKAESLDVDVAYYGRAFEDLDDLQSEIDAAVQGGTVLDSASPALRDLRRSIERQGAQIKEKLGDLLRRNKNMFTDGYVSQRNGRYVLPVKKEFKHQVAGSVVEVSGSGSTYFIEPAAARKLQEAVNTLLIEEDNELRRVLYTLTALVDECAGPLRRNMEAMASLDALFAKARLSQSMRAVSVTVTGGHAIRFRGGRHPLLRAEECVPLDFTLGGGVRGVVITGPNTGGKTVALKTVGLLAMMAQCGLHVPVEEGEFCLRDSILCDVGDGQSITENLSTFSSHITGVIEILSRATADSLVLLDELGSGTDPAEGMGIAVSILEELRRSGCLFVATTHYPEVKEYAAKAEGLLNARMAFDRESLRPLYRLELGEAGESCALYIAQRLGFPEHMLKRARACAYGGAVASGEDTPTPRTGSLLQREKHTGAPDESARRFQLGDSVTIGPDQTFGIVFRPADEKGMVGVQVKGVKSFVNHKRLTLKTPASELYPPDYDFSILFDSVEVRKARHQMDKKYVPGLRIEVDP